MEKKENFQNKSISLDDYFDWIIKNKKRIDNQKKQKEWMIKNQIKKVRARKPKKS